MEGDKWKTHRKIASQLFTGRTIRVTMAKVFAEHAEVLKTSLLKKAAEGVSFDLQLLLQSLVMDAFCTIAFSAAPGSFEKAEKGEKSAFQVAFDYIQGVSVQRMNSLPTLREIARTMKLGMESGMEDALNSADEFIYKIVRERLQQLKSMPNVEDQPKDILGLYFRHAVSKDRPDLLNEKCIRDVIMNFMIAGRDTTSFLLTNALSLLSENPSLDLRVSQECRQRLKQGSEHFALHGLKDFPLGDAIFNESLRMFPSVSFDLRYCRQDDVLPSGIPIRAGCAAVMANIALARNPKYFEDPDTFRPDRWLCEVDGKLTCKRIDEFKLPFFWAGAHSCLGKEMARVEAKVFIGVICDAIKLKMVKPRKLEFSPGPVKFYKEGIVMTAQKRE